MRGEQFMRAGIIKSSGIKEILKIIEKKKSYSSYEHLGECNQ